MRGHVGASDYCVTGTPFDLVNMTAYMHGEHHTMFDSRFLCGLLQEAGFPHVRQREYDAHFDLPDRDWESLYAYAGFQDWEAVATAIKTSRSVTRMSGEPPRG